MYLFMDILKFYLKYFGIQQSKIFQQLNDK